jgi:hypothetical protein
MSRKTMSDARYRLEIAWIRVRYSLGWLLATAATLLLVVGIYGMIQASGAVPPVVQILPSATPATVGERLSIFADWWVLTIPATAAAAWFSLKI